MPKTLLSESFPNITDLKLESFRSLWSHCCLFCSCSFLQLLSHLSEITVSLAALIPRYLLSPAGSWHIDFFYQRWSSSLPSRLTSVPASSSHVDSPVEAHLRQPTVTHYSPRLVGRGDESLSSVIFYQSLWSLVWSLPRSATQTGLCSHGNWCLVTQSPFFLWASCCRILMLSDKINGQGKNRHLVMENIFLHPPYWPFQNPTILQSFPLYLPEGQH